MTHSGGKPHAVGDKGQRYEVHATGYPGIGDNIIGWTNSPEGAEAMVRAILRAPGCTAAEFVDRQKAAVDFLPCPFCENTDIRCTNHGKVSSDPYHRGDDVWSMCCYGCGATFPNRYRRKLLVEAWNARIALAASPKGDVARSRDARRQAEDRRELPRLSRQPKTVRVSSPNRKREHPKMTTRRTVLSTLGLAAVATPAMAVDFAKPVLTDPKGGGSVHFGADASGKVCGALRALADEIEAGRAWVQGVNVTSNLQPSEFLLHHLNIEFGMRESST